MAMARGHAEHLVPMMGGVLKEAGMKYDQIDAIVTTLGPGAFTGLRIGLSSAKSLALALDIPVFGITTLQTLALQYAPDNKTEARIFVLVDTKREDFYVQMFNASGGAASEPRAIPSGDIALLARGEHVVFVGDAVERFRRLAGHVEDGWIFEDGFILPSTEIMTAVLAEQGADSAMLYRQPEPVYLRPPDVSQSKKPQRVLV